MIIDAILHCIKNNDALRGTSEIIGHPNCGRLLNTIELISHYDNVMKTHIETHNKGKLSYFSSGIQNELIGLAATKVRRHIIKDIKDGKYFSILIALIAIKNAVLRKVLLTSLILAKKQVKDSQKKS